MLFSSILIALIVICVLLWLANVFVVTEPRAKGALSTSVRVLTFAIIVVFILWLLYALGIMHVSGIPIR